MTLSMSPDWISWAQPAGSSTGTISYRDRAITYGDVTRRTNEMASLPSGIALTSLPPRKELTDDQIDDIKLRMERWIVEANGLCSVEWPSYLQGQVWVWFGSRPRMIESGYWIYDERGDRFGIGYVDQPHSTLRIGRVERLAVLKAIMERVGISEGALLELWTETMIKAVMGVLKERLGSENVQSMRVITKFAFKEGEEPAALISGRWRNQAGEQVDVTGEGWVQIEGGL